MEALGQYRRMLIYRQEQYQGLQGTLAAAVKTRGSSDLVASLRRLLTVEGHDVNHLKDQELLLEGMLQLCNFADDTVDPEARRQAVSKKWGLERRVTRRDPRKFRATLEAFVGESIYAEMTKAQLALDAKSPGHGAGSYKRSSRTAGFDDIPGGVDPNRHGSEAQVPADVGSGGQAGKGNKKGRGVHPRSKSGGGSGKGGHA